MNMQALTNAVEKIQMDKGYGRDLYSQKYAAQPIPGKDGRLIKVRANFFTIPAENFPQKIFVYSFAFPAINGRNVKNANVKKDLVKSVLDQPFFFAHKAKIATDWNATLVSTIDLTAAEDSPFHDGKAEITVAFTNQAQPGQVNQLAVGMSFTRLLPKAQLGKFVTGKNPGPAWEGWDQWMQALNILVRKNVADPTNNQAVKVGRNKFFPLEANTPAWRCGLQPRNGYYSSVVAVKGGLALNVHYVATAFITAQPLVDYVKSYDTTFRPDSWKTEDEARRSDPSFKAAAGQLQVHYRYTPPDPAAPKRSGILQDPKAGRLRRINGFGKSARRQTFSHPEHGDVTVESYYNNHVLLPSSPLRYPHLLVCNTGSKNQPVWVPAELLYIEPHQPKRGMLRDSEMSQMLKVAQRLPLQNVTQIERCFGKGGFFDAAKLMADPGLEITSEMGKFSARMLPIFSLQYSKVTADRAGKSKAGNSKGGKAMEADNSIKEGGIDGSGLRGGKWDIRGRKFHGTGSLGNLGVIDIGGGPARRAYEELLQACRSYGVAIGSGGSLARASAANTTASNLDQAYGTLQRDLRDCKLVMVVLPDSSADGYAAVKSWADKAGIHSICITPEKSASLFQAPFQANIALKINAKLGGRNHVLVDQAYHRLHGPKRSTMVVGADVTHPGVGSVPHCPSAAAVVASCDRWAVSYPGSLRLQKSKQEMIEDLDEMILERLRMWHSKNGGKLPTDILFYRDGVSDSQIAAVKAVELPKIQQGCSAAGQELGDASYAPNITLIVCNKRHHTRFYPTADRAGYQDWMLDRNNNFHPGLVVDDPEVRGPLHFDFYLQSQRALNGTARPTHYFVIHNGMGMSADILQAATFNLCWIFATALTPISYAAPAYYADRLCDRARCYLRPLQQLRHPHRPAEMALMNAALPNERGDETEDEKAYAVCRLLARGWGGFWPVHNGPSSQTMRESMYYI